MRRVRARFVRPTAPARPARWSRSSPSRGRSNAAAPRPCRPPAPFPRPLEQTGRSRPVRLGIGRGLRLCRSREWFGFDERRRGLGRAAVEIGDRTGGFRSRCRPEFVRDRSGETVFRSAAPAASAATSTTARPPFAAGRLIAARHRRAVRRPRPRRLRHRRRPRASRLRRRRGVASHCPRAGRPPSRGSPERPRRRRRRLRSWPSASLSPPAPSAADRIVGQPLGLFGFDLGFGFDVERLLVVIRLPRPAAGRRPPAPPAAPWPPPAYAPVRRGR